MKCNKCGSELESGAKFCAVCGEPVPQAPEGDGAAQQPYQSAPQQQPTYNYGAPQQDASYSYGAAQPQASPVYANVPPVSGTAYLVWSIIVTIFCCLPLGIPGIVFASKWSSSSRSSSTWPSSALRSAAAITTIKHPGPSGPSAGAAAAFRRGIFAPVCPWRGGAVAKTAHFRVY